MIALYIYIYKHLKERLQFLFYMFLTVTTQCNMKLVFGFQHSLETQTRNVECYVCFPPSHDRRPIYQRPCRVWWALSGVEIVGISTVLPPILFEAPLDVRVQRHDVKERWFLTSPASQWSRAAMYPTCDELGDYFVVWRCQWARSKFPDPAALQDVCVLTVLIDLSI